MDLFIMSGMKEVFALQIHFQQVGKHQTHQLDGGENLSEQSLVTLSLRDSNENRERNQKKKPPPFNGPREGNDSHQYRKETTEH